MEANTIFNCSRTMEVSLPNSFVFWQMLVTKVWRNFTKTARRLSRNPNITRWRKARSREIVPWLENGLWLNIFFVSWKSFVSSVRGIGIAERDLLYGSIWSPRFTTSNSTITDFCKRSIIDVILDGMIGLHNILYEQNLWKSDAMINSILSRIHWNFNHHFGLAEDLSHVYNRRRWFNTA